MKRILSIFLLVTLILTFVSCAEKATDLSEKKDVEKENTEAIENDETDEKEKTDKEKEDESEPETDTHEVTVDLYYYDVVSDSHVSKKCTSSVLSSLGADDILTLLEEHSGVHIAYNGVKIKNKAAYVDFSADGAPITGAGSSGEAGILESVAVTLLKNLEKIDAVYYTCDGKAYESGHIFIPLEQPYMVREDLEYIDEPTESAKEDVYSDAYDDRDLR